MNDVSLCNLLPGIAGPKTNNPFKSAGATGSNIWLDANTHAEHRFNRELIEDPFISKVPSDIKGYSRALGRAKKCLVEEINVGRRRNRKAG